MILLVRLLIIAFLLAVASGYTKFPIRATLNDVAHNYHDARDLTLGSSSAIWGASTAAPSPADSPREDEDYDYGDDGEGVGEDPDQRGHENKYIRVIRRVPHHPDAAPPPPPLPRARKISYNDNDNQGWPSGADLMDDGYQSDQAPPGDLTAHKLNLLGTNEGVQEARKNYSELPPSLPVLAMRHLNDMEREGACRKPREVLHYVAQETNTKYIPSATFVHRCSRDFGCCDVGYSCQAKIGTVQYVEKAFYVSVIGRRTIAKLIELEDHTECECRRDEVRRKRSTHCHCPKHFIDFSWPGGSSGSSAFTTEIMPSLATSQRCRCDCHLNDDTCKRLKNGEEGFSVLERRRIQRGEVSPPFCSYGSYDMKNGRCPRPGYQNQKTNPNLNFIPMQPQSRRQNGKS